MDLGLDQKEVAERIGTTVSNVWNWENGRRAPQPRFIAPIYDFLGYCLFDPGWSFGESVRRRREALGLTQKEFAHRLGVDPATVRSWEAGLREPTAKSVRRLAVSFNCGEPEATSMPPNAPNGRPSY